MAMSHAAALGGMFLHLHSGWVNLVCLETVPKTYNGIKFSLSRETPHIYKDVVLFTVNHHGFLFQAWYIDQSLTLTLFISQTSTKTLR